MTKYNVTIGLEMHCECDKTNTKVFSSAKNAYSDKPNTNVRAIEMAFPGILPVVNKECIKNSIMMSLILHCKQPEYIYFERKNYYYPDLPKGYQITQNPPEECAGMNGYIDIIRPDKTTFRVGIDNIHLEEDAARMEHLYDTSLIDYNRAGVPLFELVTTPSIHSAEDAILFLEYIRSIYQYCNISSADSRKGQLRCDVNVSLSDTDKLGTKVEVKNVNSFSGVYDAINYEIKRQTELIESGRQDKIEQETRRWDEDEGITIRMRSKVDAEDYKYFVDPNLPKFKLSKTWIEEIEKTIPILPYERKDQYINEYKLSEYDATVLIKDIKYATYFEKLLENNIEPKIASNWVTGNLLGYINNNDTTIDKIYMTPERLSIILNKMNKGTISSKQAKELFFKVLETKEEPDSIIKKENMEQISDSNELESIIESLLSKFPEQIKEYHNGKTNMFDFFVGQVMKETRGKANPVIVKEILNEHLN